MEPLKIDLTFLSIISKILYPPIPSELPNIRLPVRLVKKLWLGPMRNVSQYPTYYKSDFKGGLTNVGAFFDQNNHYTDITGPRTDAQIGDICYVSKDGEKVCLENDKLQNVPPSLVSDVNQCGFLNSLGLLQYSNQIDTSQERVINGGVLYDNVKGSKKYNEMYSEPLFGQVMECQI